MDRKLYVSGKFPIYVSSRNKRIRVEDPRLKIGYRLVKEFDTQEEADAFLLGCKWMSEKYFYG